MKTTKFISALLLIATSFILIPSCKDDDEDGKVNTPIVYFNASIKYNNTPPQTFTSDEYTFEARIYPTGSDTLVFEGERSSDASYLFFNLINDDLYSFTAGDSIVLPYDIATGTEVFCSLLVNSVSTEIFHPGAGVDQGMVYIDEIDYNKKMIAGRVHCTLYSGTDSLKLENGIFRIDQ